MLFCTSYGYSFHAPVSWGVGRSSADWPCRATGLRSTALATWTTSRCSHPQRTFDKYWAAETGLEPDRTATLALVSMGQAFQLIHGHWTEARDGSLQPLRLRTRSRLNNGARCCFAIRLEWNLPFFPPQDSLPSIPYFLGVGRSSADWP